jgi:DNA-binding transcriptional LysR family regulator
MKYSDLEKVLAIYEERSFTAAAKRLYLTQPAISQNIAQLEKELNVLLFVRDNGKIIPTPACETFVSYASQIRELWKGLEKEIKSYQPDHILHIGTTSFFFRFLSYKTEAMFGSRKPEFQYTIIEDAAGNVERMTHEGKLDFCFTRAPLHQKTLKFEPFFTEEILFALPADHPVCQQYPASVENPFPTIDLSVFKGSDFVMVNNARITPLCYKICENAGYLPKVTMQPVSWEHVIMGIRTGRGVGFLSNLHIKKNDDGDLRYFHINSELAKLEHVVAYRSSYDLNPAAREFINSFRAYVRSTLASF